MVRIVLDFSFLPSYLDCMTYEVTQRSHFQLVIPRGLATGILFPNNRRVSKSTVQKASHCAWQIHYHIVFPVKYRKALLADDVVEIITEVTRGLAERYDMEFERLGCDRNHIHLLCSAHPKIAPGQIVRVFKSITATRIVSAETGIEERAVGWGILVRWLLCGDRG